MKYSAMCPVFLMIASFAAFSQTTFEEQAARLQDINAFLLDMRPGTAPVKPDRISFSATLDLTPQPDLDTRVGNKDEKVDPPSVVPRLRLRMESPFGLFVGGTYVPGMELDGYEADYYGLEAGYRFKISNLHGQLRGAYLDGDVTGPVTEEESDDFFTFQSSGFDFSLGYIRKAFCFYGFAGHGSVDTTLDIQSDGVRLTNDNQEMYGGLGINWRHNRWELTLEQNVTGDFLRHLVLSVGYRF